MPASWLWEFGALAPCGSGRISIALGAGLVWGAGGGRFADCDRFGVLPLAAQRPHTGLGPIADDAGIPLAVQHNHWRARGFAARPSPAGSALDSRHRVGLVLDSDGRSARAGSRSFCR